MTRISKATARLAICRPMLPMPRMTIVAPVNSTEPLPTPERSQTLLLVGVGRQQAAGEQQQHAEGVLGDAGGVAAARVGQGDVALDQLGDVDDALDAGRGADPLERVFAGQIRLARHAVAHPDLGAGHRRHLLLSGVRRRELDAGELLRHSAMTASSGLPASTTFMPLRLPSISARAVAAPDGSVSLNCGGDPGEYSTRAGERLRGDERADGRLGQRRPDDVVGHADVEDDQRQVILHAQAIAAASITFRSRSSASRWVRRSKRRASGLTFGSES